MMAIMASYYPSVITTDNCLLSLDLIVVNANLEHMETISLIMPDISTLDRQVAIPWSFDAVFAFSAAFADTNASSAHYATTNIRRQDNYHSGGNGLGDFRRIWEHIGEDAKLGKNHRVHFLDIVDDPPYDDPLKSRNAEYHSDLSTATTAISGSPLPREEHWNGRLSAIQATNTSSISIGQTTRRSQVAASKRRRDVIYSTVGDGITERPSISELAKVHPSKHRKHSTALISSDTDTEVEAQHSTTSIQLRPLKIDIKRPVGSIDRAYVAPAHIWSREQQADALSSKIRLKFPLPSSADAPQNVSTCDSDLHIFVDASNIVISFFEKIKRSRGFHPSQPLSNVPFNFRGLAQILERGRRVERRILVGSHRASLHSLSSKRAPYLVEAEKCLYEINLLERVLKHKPSRQAKQRLSNGNGYATISGYSSGDEHPTCTPKVMSEQAVDEILHMKLLESLVDATKPATIVLASGDAAEAEYSGGFLRNVERALERGWKVELVAWRDNIGYEYRNHAFLAKWKGKFSIIELDDFLEELLALCEE